MLNFTGDLADVEIHLAGRTADIAEIRVSHLARSVDDTTHDGDLDALEMGGGRLDAGRRALKVEECPSAARAGDIVGLEDSCPGGLKNIVGEPQRLPGPEGSVIAAPCSIMSPCTRTASPMPSQSNAPIFVAAVSKMERKSEICVGRKRILQENRMPRFESAGQHPEGRDHRKIDAISHGDERSRGSAFTAVDFRVVRRIDFPDAGLLIDDLGLIIAEAVDLVGKFVVASTGARRRGPTPRLQASRR